MNAADFLASKAFEYAANFENKATKLKSDLEKIKRRERLVEFELDAARSAILRAHAFRGRIGTNFQCLLPKTLQVLRQLGRERQVAGVEAFDLLNAGAGVLGEVEDVHPALRENDPHANRGVA
jgi:hypothetical protein